MAGDEHDELGTKLIEIEQASGKRAVKRHRARPSFREKYIEEVARLTMLRGAIFVQSFSNTMEFSEMTAHATANAILICAPVDYEVTMFVDGLRKSEVPRFGKELRFRRVKVRKVRGIRRDENNQYVRLVDSICGLVRDATEGQAWARKLVERLKQRGLLTELG
jgi:hypothetical protein